MTQVYWFCDASGRSLKLRPFAIEYKSNMTVGGADPYIVAVEGGGTSFRVAICRVPPDYTLRSKDNVPFSAVMHRIEIDSSHDRPADTLAECVTFLTRHKPIDGYAALGIATFGPVGVRAENSEEYGRILPTTPKAYWRNVDILSPLKEACQGRRPLAVRIDTDVNAPALAEYIKAKQHIPNITSTAYITVGTGVEVGLVVNGTTVHGRMHPEGGHVPVQPLPGDTFGGYSWGARCPFHGQNTVEGLTSSVALTERLQKYQGIQETLSRSSLQLLSDEHDVWSHAANAIANLCATLLLTLSVERIVLGGGIMNRKGLLENIQKKTVYLINGYLSLPVDDMSSLILMSTAGSDSGLVGAIVLAERAFVEASEHNQEDIEIRLKQVAFGHGFWHGLLVGGIGVALVCKYFWRSRR